VAATQARAAMTPTASISSMKIMHGAFFLPCSNKSRTREAPTPTNISTKSEPEIEKKEHLLHRQSHGQQSLAGSRGPIMSTPLECGRRAFETSVFFQEFNDLLKFFLGFFDPATSLNVTRFC